MTVDQLSVEQDSANLQDYDQTKAEFQWSDAEVFFSWHETGQVNIVYEAIDRHVEAGRGNQTALHYLDANREEEYTFAELKKLSNRFAQMLLSLGVAKGDRVFLLMPRSPELVIALMGTMRMGAIAGPLFEAFMADAVRDRLEDSAAAAVVTTTALKDRIDRAALPELRHVIVVGHTEAGAGSEPVAVEDGEVDYYAHMAEASDEDALQWVDKEDPMFLFYTSGSTGKPKGVVHVHYGMVQMRQAAQWVLDLHEGDVYWCTADQGWITGTSMGILGPWLKGNTIVIRGGRYNPDDWYSTLEKYCVNVWFSAPTAFRMLMNTGEDTADKYDLSTLRHILSAGEPLNPEVLRWAKDVYGIRIHDNWWMTETGAPMISNYASLPIKLGSMGRPLPGIEASIVDDDGHELPPGSLGNLVIRPGWPAMVRTIWNRPQKYADYFRFEGWFTSGDSAYQDEEGYFWYMGRVDDVINTAGERVGPFELESCLIEHPSVAEAGVIGKPDVLRGEVIKAFICLREGYDATDELRDEISQFVKGQFAAHAAPREIEFVEKLPKTRSGKIMRRVLKAQELGLPTGDLSTMED